MQQRKIVDYFFRYLFAVVALFSVLALGAILLFVFVHGSMPFFTATSQDIRLVVQNVDEFSVNGDLYQNHSTFVYVSRDNPLISFRYPSGDGGEVVLDIAYDAAEKDPRKQLSFTYNNEVNITYPESYVYTVSWPAIIAAMEKRVHIILPEPPYGVLAFLTGLEWRPDRDKIYGIFPMIAGTLVASFGAILLGVPVALLTALFMAEFLSPRIAAIVRAGVELLAGIPSVVYGFFGLMVIVPAIRNIFQVPSGSTLLAAIIVLAIMILPTVITIAETSLRAVPLSVREASLAVGATKMQTTWCVVLPHASSGVIAGVILGISRAVGETMAVILVAGNSPHLFRGPLESVRTLTATIAMEMGYASGRHSEMLFSIGITLFTIILILNSFILWFRRKIEVSS